MVEDVATALEDFNLVPTCADTCVWMSADKKLGIATIVDDMAIAGPAERVEELIKHLEGKFAIKRLGDLNVFVGLEVTRDRNQGTLTIKQTRYAKEILKRFDMLDCKPVRTPIPCGFQYGRIYDNEELGDQKLY